VIRTLFVKFFLFLALFSLISGGVLLFRLTLQIENRFSGKRWNVPSQVYSDVTPLFPGVTLNRKAFLTKLANLGYRPSEKPVPEKGMFSQLPGELRVYLKDIHLTHFDREGYPLRLVFDKNTISSMTHAATGAAISYLELEPEEIGLFFGPEREKRLLVSLSQVPLCVRQAVIVAEDRGFYSHFGLDVKGILRALYVNILSGKIRQGGSTLTQQLAKNYFLSPERTFSRKIKEMVISLVIEGLYDKEEILEIYLNEIYLGQNGSVAINGVGEASYFYFGKEIGELSVHEAAVIAGLIKAPNIYSPYKDGERCRKRRDEVLYAMAENGYLSKRELEKAVIATVSPQGYLKYGRKAPYFMDYLAQQLEKLYPSEILRSEGLTILTTLDTQVQLAAESALEKGLQRIDKRISGMKRKKPDDPVQGAVIVMHPRTGDIVAMVGGRDYGKSQFNRAVSGIRQPGSLFKPFVFLSALDTFYPSSTLDNREKAYAVNGKPWRPKNFSPDSPGSVTLREALAYSYNLATLDLTMKTGMNTILSTVALFGFSTRMEAVPSLALGACEAIPLELAAAYCVFSSDGVLPSPLSVRKVLDASGSVIERRHMKIRSVTSPEKAYIITSMLETAIQEGTGRSLKSHGLSFPVAGKTGTTNHSKDAWFIGYTPDILALVWVGFDNGDSLSSTGGQAALPIWGELMKHIPHHISGKGFNRPPGVETLTICRDSGLPANSGCVDTGEELFLQEKIPENRCPSHEFRAPVNNRLWDRIRNLFP
jgi:penicillin-binding protein 1B